MPTSFLDHLQAMLFDGPWQRRLAFAMIALVLSGASWPLMAAVTAAFAIAELADHVLDRNRRA